MVWTFNNNTYSAFVEDIMKVVLLAVVVGKGKDFVGGLNEGSHMHNLSFPNIIRWHIFAAPRKVFAVLDHCSDTSCQLLPTSEERRQSIRNNTSALFAWRKMV